MQNANGNMTMDLDRGITEIKYNLLNLPEEIRFSGGETIKNLYAADGRKLQSSNIFDVSTVNVPIILTGYLPGVGEYTDTVYVAVTVYDGYGTKYTGNKEYLFSYKRVPDAPGYAPVGGTPVIADSITGLRVHNTEGYVDDAGNYNYYRRDHLGNNREVWQFPPSGGQGAVIQRTQYYPSGLPWAYSDGDGADKQPYKYGGKEFIEAHGYDAYDFHARMRMGAVPVFETFDPLAEKRPWESPYCYAGNNPIMYIDPTGLAWRPTFNEDQDGNRTYNGYEWIPEDQSYDTDGNLLAGLYAQAIFFSDNGTFGASSKYNMGSSTATVYKADGTTTTFDANTRPSSEDYATVPEGIYHATVGKHKGDYTALKMRDVDATSQTIELGQANPAHPERTYATGINIHKPGLNNLTGLTSSGTAISQGCLLIDRNSWSDFIGIFNTDAQRSNTVSVTLSRTYSRPINHNSQNGFYTVIPYSSFRR